MQNAQRDLLSRVLLAERPKHCHIIMGKSSQLAAQSISFEHEVTACLWLRYDYKSHFPVDISTPVIDPFCRLLLFSAAAHGK
jgi:hypothetical protein